MMERLRKLDRRKVGRIENLLIVLLSISAILLIGQTGIFQSSASRAPGQSGTTAFSSTQGSILSQGTPVGLLVKNQYGRYGCFYDQARVDDLYAQGLEDLLVQSLAAAGNIKQISRSEWQQAVTQNDLWVCYDFLCSISFTHQTSQKTARYFLLTGKNGRADTLYYTTESGESYTASLQESPPSLPDCLSTLAPNGACFAFEDSALADAFPPTMILVPDVPVCPVYTASNPLEALSEEEQSQLAKALGFNLRATTLYQSTDGTVIREGADTLRIQKDGTLILHTSEGEESRWQALSRREKDQQFKAEALLAELTEGLSGEGRLRCQSITTLENGETELLFCCLLNGAVVNLENETWVARFRFQEETLISFELRLRQYELTQETCAVLPLRQAAAAADCLGQGGKELQLCYADSGETGPISASWVIPETD